HLYLVRHGETKLNKQGRFQGHIDVPLNEKGKQQAIKLGNYFKNIPIDNIYTSDLKRAIQTAVQISKHHHVPLETEESIRERSYGEWEGISVREVSKQVPNMKSILQTGGKFGVEKEADLQKRLAQFLNQYVLTEQNKTIILVSHAGLICSCVNFLTENKIDVPVSSLTHTGVTHFTRINNREWKMVSLNESSHLKVI